MKNFIQEGYCIPYTNASGAAITSGSVVISGNIIGIAVDDIAIGDTQAIRIQGVFRVTKNTGVAFAVGDKVFWNEGSSYATATNTDTYIGVATQAQVNADTTVTLKLKFA